MACDNGKQGHHGLRVKYFNLFDGVARVELGEWQQMLRARENVGPFAGRRRTDKDLAPSRLAESDAQKPHFGSCQLGKLVTFLVIGKRFLIELSQAAGP